MALDEKTAKILTIAGGADCLVALILAVLSLTGYVNLPVFIPLLLFIAGIMLVFVSLAYYTKK